MLPLFEYNISGLNLEKFLIFENLEKYYSKQQIVDMVSVIAFFGFLKRWNDTFGTEIEAVPAQYIDEVLKPKNW